MRLLAVDLGTKRIGIALGESMPHVVSPRTALEASGKLATDALNIAALARREEVNRIVLGLPVELDGNEGRMARVVRQLGTMIEAEGFTVDYVDEAYTSVEAEAALLAADLKGSERRKRRDGEAACRILERYLAQG